MRLRYLLSFLLIVTLTGGAWALPQEIEEKEDQLIVTEENELAPVAAISEELMARLSKPVENIDLSLIMEGPAFFGYEPSSIRWDGDGGRLWYVWQRWDEKDSSTYEYTVSDGSVRVVDEKSAELLPPGWGANWNKDFSEVLWTSGDTLYRAASGGEAEALIKGLRGVRFSAFHKSGGYLLSYDNNLLLLKTDGEFSLSAISDIRSGNERDDEPSSKSQQWLKEQQKALFQIISDRAQDSEEREASRREGKPEPYYLGRNSLVSTIPSADAVYAALLLRIEDRNNRMAEMPDYVTESGYTESRKVRLKVGDSQDAYSLSFLHLETGAAQAVDFGLDKRETRIMGLEWSPNNDHALVQVRAADNKDRWFFLVTPELKKAEDETALELKVEQLSHDHDEAWINWDVARDNGWLSDGSGYYFISERDGYRNLYLQKLDAEPELLFGGKRIIHSAELHSALNAFVVAASFEENLHSVHTFLIGLDGSVRQLTDHLGRSMATVSPNGDHLAILSSGTATPTELFVRKTDDKGPGEQLTNSPSPAFSSYDWSVPAVEYVMAEDGTKVPAQVYKPSPDNTNGAGIVFVHGAGYMQNVHNWWRGFSYGRVYCFNVLMAAAGYTVIDIDYRGSEGYGRDWRTAIYRSMGGKDLSDQVDGARHLAEKYNVDPERIGIYGGSYGGFMTLMALFNEPESFAAGAAMRPVTDWAHYNHPYTSNILNSPQDDPEAYLFSSPIYHAEGLQGHLLITHGIVDDNVHIQGVFRLVQRLIELRKENWEVAVYPVERHGFLQPSSWFDQYRRIKLLFDQTIADK